MQQNIDLLEFAGSVYSINFEAFDRLLAIDSLLENNTLTEVETITTYNGANQIISTVVSNREYPRGKEIDMTKYEMIKFLLEIIMTYNEEIDDGLGAQRMLDKLPINFKIAFNTLVRYGILSEIK